MSSVGEGSEVGEMDEAGSVYDWFDEEEPLDVFDFSKNPDAEEATDPVLQKLINENPALEDYARFLLSIQGLEFKKLELATQLLMLGDLKEELFEANQNIIEEGDAADRFFFIKGIHSKII